MPGDIAYMRYYQAGRVLRVARIDTAEGQVLALYPNPDGSFSGEAFREVSDESPRRKIGRKDLKDSVWLRLLDGKGIEEILTDYEPVGGSGTDNKGSYYFAKRGSSFDISRRRTFHIEDDKNEEDILAERERWSLAKS